MEEEIRPVVFALGDAYQIALAANDRQVMMWVRVGEETFYDADNGILRSAPGVRRVLVPADLLEREKSYTVFLRTVRERKAYFTRTGDVTSQRFAFCPVEGSRIRFFHIADVHNHDASAIRSAEAFGPMDFLILNGDIPNHCDDPENIFSIYRIAWELTHGRIPVLFSRGNHDMRGKYAEHFSDYVPQWNGKFYYTFRLGPIWGIVLDCGEDKMDDHPEYGSTICCSDYRRKETEFIRQVTENARNEYAKAGVQYRLVICHIPFTRRFAGEFDIEEGVYAEWTRLLRESIRPQLILCGHEHQIRVYEPGSENDAYGQPCPVVIGAGLDLQNDTLVNDCFTGAGFTCEEDRIHVEFVDSDGKIRGNYDAGPA